MVSFRTSCQTKKHSFVQNKNRFPKGGDFFYSNTFLMTNRMKRMMTAMMDPTIINSMTFILKITRIGSNSFGLVRETFQDFGL